MIWPVRRIRELEEGLSSCQSTQYAAASRRRFAVLRRASREPRVGARAGTCFFQLPSDVAASARWSCQHSWTCARGPEARGTVRRRCLQALRTRARRCLF
ncbi:hypothetical protein C8Q79DRAFT_950918 [Trametes meyenii]|nr:hypothetical protein C8Q79DRAFT_950918 [Trametes meyenii]